MRVDFLEPGDFSEAVALLADRGDEAKIIAGGTSVVLMLRQKLIAPTTLVSLGRVSGWDYIRREPDGLHLGALLRLRDAERSPLLGETFPALEQAIRVVGNVRVRSQATLGGNLCAADYAADPPAILLALDARLNVVGPAGSRLIPLSEFTLGFYTTALEPGEIVSEIVIPTLPESARMAYLRYTSVSAVGRPCVAAGAVADFDADGKCRDLRVAVGAAVETPQRLAHAETLALGQPLTNELVAEIAEEYARSLDPISDVRGTAWYRREMIRVFIKRLLKEVRDDDR